MSVSCEQLSSHHAAMRSAACPILASISGLKCLIKPCSADKAAVCIFCVLDSQFLLLSTCTMSTGRAPK